MDQSSLVIDHRTSVLTGEVAQTPDPIWTFRSVASSGGVQNPRVVHAHTLQWEGRSGCSRVG